MKKILICMIALFLTVLGADICSAEQQYNPFTHTWETVPDNSDWSPKYNPFEHKWSIQPDDAQTEYNPFNDKWEWDSGKNERWD